MEIRSEEKGTFTVINPIGSLDFNNSTDFEKKVMSVIEAGNQNIIIDFAQLNFISSAGLRVLLMTAKKLKSSGGKLGLSSLNEQISEVLTISGFTAIFAIFDTADDAIAQL
jgi:anti-anti-sigma factor